MHPRSRIALCLAAALASSACSTRPRQFSATVRPTDPGQMSAGRENADFATCDKLVRAGRGSGFAAGAATGAAGGAAALGGAAVGTSGLVGGSLSTAGAAGLAAMPVFGFAAAFGVNRMIRSGKERKYRRLMGNCLHEFGHEVVDWTKAPKRQPGSAIPVPAPAPGPTPPPMAAQGSPAPSDSR